MTHIKQFLKTNDNSEVNDSTLWETLKVYIRGQIISYEARMKRVKPVRLEKELLAAQQAYKNSLSQSDYNNILKLKYEYNSILENKLVIYYLNFGNILLKL